MIPSMDDTLLQKSWSRDLDLFFVDRKLGRIANNVRRVHDELRRIADAPQVPSYGDIQALTQGEAISLLSVCRLRYCLELARRTNNIQLLFFFEIDPAAPGSQNKGIPINAGKVIPSINVFDRDRYAEVKRDLNIQLGELTAFANQAMRRNLNAELFEGELERGYSPAKDGNSTGFYRVTDYVAGIIYNFLTLKAGPVGYDLRPLSHYLPRNPTHGPGNGKWCRSLLRGHGNYWPQ
jgi:hypothetical protein